MATENWPTMPLGEFVTLQRGHDLPTERRRWGGVPVLGSFGITGWHDEARAPGPGVTVGRSGASFGVVSYSPVDYWPLNTALYVVDFHGNDPRFAYYFLKAFDFRNYNSGSAQPSLNRNFIHPVRVAIPPLPEQRAVATFLGAIDDKIKLNRRMSETLETMARALFTAWFVNFEPVRAKAQGRDTDLPEQIAELFSDRLGDSVLGEIPAGWTVGRFGDVVEHLREPDNPLVSPETLFAHYSIPAFDNGQVAELEFGNAIKSVKWRVPAGTILLSKLNPEIERVWVPDVAPGERAVCSTEFLVLRPREPFTRAYAYCLARSPLLRQQVEALVTGTSRSHQRARAEAILDLPVALPLPQLITAFDSSVRDVQERVLAAHRETNILTTLRDALMPKLISGELLVPQAKQVVEAVPA